MEWGLKLLSGPRRKRCEENNIMMNEGKSEPRDFDVEGIGSNPEYSDRRLRELGYAALVGEMLSAALLSRVKLLDTEIEKLRDERRTDSLTKIHNEIGFHEFLEKRKLIARPDGGDFILQEIANYGVGGGNIERIKNGIINS